MRSSKKSIQNTTTVIYRIRLTEPQVFALTDIGLDYQGEDTYRRDRRVLDALARRKLIVFSTANPGSARLTWKGRMFLDAALAERHGNDRAVRAAMRAATGG